MGGCCSNSAAGEYDDYDWNELPENVRDAAKKLGYDKKMWDNDGKPPADDKDWEELTPEEQEAAKVLGYDEAKWDAD